MTDPPPPVVVVETPEAVVVEVKPTGVPVTIIVPAHDQKITHHYTVRYPDHTPRASDPHYAAFNAFKKRTKSQAVCYVGARFNDFSMCVLDKPLEVHHTIIEFAIQNSVDLKALEIDFPEIQTKEELDAFVESDKNFVWYCQFHHRGHGGAHTASAADFEAQMYVMGLIT